MSMALSFPEFYPAIVSIPQFSIGGLTLGPINILWYAMAYVLGLVLGWRYAVALVKRPRLFGGTSPTSSEVIDDYLFWATLGVILGGRLGYMFFYQIPYQFDDFAADPMMILRVWDGGMAFHGGLIGVGLATWHVCRTHKIPLLRMTDIAAAATPIGLLLGRCANFINAELYGRPTDSAFGMIFPQGYGSGGPPQAFDWDTKEWQYICDPDLIPAAARTVENCSVRLTDGSIISELPRHPSQLYEAGLEGLLLFIVIAIAIWAFGALKRPGLVTGIFLLGYAMGRSIAERFRLPDAFVDGLPDWMTMGTLLSVPMIALGVFLVWRALKSAPPSPTSTAAAE
ncbi:MAG: prolipoprotein diacylglyceryl transferase [Hyphomonadaceae bacterium TMED5]|nr:prolipoprotein diacylglyceryl transferase [Ponticaulis sp.]OUY00931.1 MAG: prolipoprotein diacylglyceryl transferase [Hyphomonadaceae bacterium TMED5]|tara:strand:- start:7825 stop:8847 length:1023 start_codon:yes stop_codon:yes gene_type:complete